MLRHKGSILAAKWVVRCLEGTSPWQVLLWHRLLSTQHVGKIRGLFGLCDILSTHIISRLQALLFSGVFGQPGGRWQVWFVGRCQVAELGGTWPRRPIWSWKLEGTCVSDLPCFQARRLSREDLFLEGFVGCQFCSWKDWHSVAREFALSPCGSAHFFGDCWAHPTGRSVQDEH
jgi:hypothetical protein